MTRRIATIAGVVATVGLLALAVAAPALAGRSGRDEMHGWRAGASGEPATISAARERAEQYLTENGYTGLEVRGVIQFSSHFYIAVGDATTGNGAMELIVSRDARVAHLAGGPAMMWNTTWAPAPMSGAGMMDQQMHGGMHGSMGPAMRGAMMGQQASHGHGMMDREQMHDRSMTPADCSMAGGSTAGATLETPLTVDEARDAAQAWLVDNRDGVTATTALEFPGYVTFVTERAGTIDGLISVQLSTGAIWGHTSHGAFVAQEGIQ
jgi:hypothetical protein